MLYLGIGTSTLFAQTLKTTVGVPSFFPAKTAALTLSNLHPQSTMVILCMGWQVPGDHMNYSEVDLAFVSKVEGKDTMLPFRASGLFLAPPG